MLPSYSRSRLGRYFFICLFALCVLNLGVRPECTRGGRRDVCGNTSSQLLTYVLLTSRFFFPYVIRAARLVRSMQSQRLEPRCKCFTQSITHFAHAIHATPLMHPSRYPQPHCPPLMIAFVTALSRLCCECTSPPRGPSASAPLPRRSRCQCSARSGRSTNPFVLPSLGPYVAEGAMRWVWDVDSVRCWWDSSAR